MSGRVGVAVLAFVASTSGAWALAQVVESFPHADHEGLFPLCAGCHDGIETGVAEDLYPDPSSCTTCHDGVREDTVEWSGPTPQPSNLIYSHPDHDELLADAGESADCVTCHQEVDAEVRMAVGGARWDTCLTCHVPEPPQHLAYVNECAVCHTSIWDATELSMARLEAFPQPDDHSPSFILEHARLDVVGQATCATCHARESCERCHANAGAVPAIASLERDARVAMLIRGIPAEYPVPVEHQASDWAWNHSAAGDEIGSCANCHTQPSCTACHTERVNAQVAELPLGGPAGPPGVSVGDPDGRVHRGRFRRDSRSTGRSAGGLLPGLPRGGDLHLLPRRPGHAGVPRGELPGGTCLVGLSERNRVRLVPHHRGVLSGMSSGRRTHVPGRDRCRFPQQGTHGDLQCVQCHADGPSLAVPDLDCQSCHEEHHSVSVSGCLGCHREPASEVHELVVHSTCAGSGCHEDVPVGSAPRNRTGCLWCHQEEAEHEPEGECVACHLMPAPRPF